MKRPFSLVVYTVFASAVLGCASTGTEAETRAVSVRASNTLLPRGQLQDLTGSAFDALQLIPAYTSRANQTPRPHFVLYLDGGRVEGLDMLSGMRANELLEIRLVSELHSTANGEVQVVVTTVGHRRAR